MYAARYAGLPEYEKLLDKGVRKYPASPVLLYLAGLRKHGAGDNSVGRDYLERAAALDPTYMDPWYALVTHYMSQADQERLNLALRRLLEGGVIPDQIMDYSYNMLVGLDQDAILITNGDNDTYPGFILTQLLGVRPDVMIVNRSLLNAEWYPGYMMEMGLIPFITQDELADLRTQILADLEAGRLAMPPIGPFGDPLIERLVSAAAAAGRPVYFSWTLLMTDTIRKLMENGRPLGLVVRVTPPPRSHEADLQRALDTWLQEYRTGGLDSWQLRYAKAADASLQIMWNYAGALHRMNEDINRMAPTYRAGLFEWYQRYVTELLPQEMASALAEIWCEMLDVPEISSWCRSQDLVR
jgi:hypothetical protein